MVLRGQNLHDSFDLGRSTNHRVELVVASSLREVASELVQDGGPEAESPLPPPLRLELLELLLDPLELPDLRPEDRTEAG